MAKGYGVFGKSGKRIGIITSPKGNPFVTGTKKEANAILKSIIGDKRLEGWIRKHNLKFKIKTI